jgi:hypothetical protein
VSVVIIDDHLLGDILRGTVPRALQALLRRNDVATTNLYYYRLCRAALSGRGGALTGSWTPEHRQEMARVLAAIPANIHVWPMHDLAFRMGELARDFQLSALASEAASAAERHGAQLCVWSGDDGPRLRECCQSNGIRYRAIVRD